MTDVLILGAGAAGLMAAYTASACGLQAVVVDHSPVVGRKMRLAGGGMGNVTNRTVSAAWYVGQNPAFVTPALKGCSPEHILALLDCFAIPWEEREHGQIFCLQPAARLVEALVETSITQGARVLLRRDVGDVVCVEGLFSVETSEERLSAPRLLLALGSAAWGASGATDRGLALARLFGHKIVPPYPVLTPLIMPAEWPLHGLQGISLPVRVRVNGGTLEDPLLFTHRGLSGPVILQASCFWRPNMELVIDFLPNTSLVDLMHAPENGRLSVGVLLRKVLPARLADLLAGALATQQVAQINKDTRKHLAAAVHNHHVVPTRTEGMAKAEAAAGGVDTSTVNPKTMESRLHPNLYFAGEVLDIAGRLGGYNLHWAFASGKAAVEAMRRKN